MNPFTTLRSRAVHLPEERIDTDVIFPARFLLIMDREGLGKYLFHDRRYDRNGKPVPGFILDRPEYAGAQVLVAGAGFGCGSSREQAVWALAGHGIRCVIAPDFGDIFASNCLKNGVLPVTLPMSLVKDLGKRAESLETFTVDLEKRSISVSGEKVAGIDIAEGQREALINGWDETDILLAREGEAIASFENAHRLAQPWLFTGERT